ncbi:MAG: lysophospholipid acyltransferase family protein [Alphaproteobacteria bacterium]
MFNIGKFIKKIIKTGTGQNFIAFLGALFIKTIYHSNRWTYVNRRVLEEHVKNNQPAIICFWHGRLMMLPKAWVGPTPFYMLLSHHADGRLIAKVISYFGIRVIYGSTSRKGEQASREMLSTLARREYVGITPDGPRGPGYQVTPGIIKLAHMAGVPIIPISYATKRRKFLRTWDRFHLPLPFGKAVFICGEPIHVDDVSPEKLAAYQQKLQDSLQVITAQADQLTQDI